MPESAKFLIIILGITALICLIKMIKSKHFVKCALVSSLSGIGSLFALNLITFITGIKISLNWFTLIFCAITGISGSISLLLINLLRIIKF